MSQNKDRDTSPSTEQDFTSVLELVEQLAAILERTDLTEVRIRENAMEVRVARHPRQPSPYQNPPLHPVETDVVMRPQRLPIEDTDGESNAHSESSFIHAPMPSRFYRSPAPEEPPFVEVGDLVSDGETVAMLEVMKTYNPVEAPFNCEILDILVEDGEAVEYEQPLFRIRQQ